LLRKLARSRSAGQTSRYVANEVQQSNMAVRLNRLGVPRRKRIESADDPQNRLLHQILRIKAATRRWRNTFTCFSETSALHRGAGRAVPSPVFPSTSFSDKSQWFA